MNTLQLRFNIENEGYKNEVEEEETNIRKRRREINISNKKKLRNNFEYFCEAMCTAINNSATLYPIPMNILIYVSN